MGAFSALTTEPTDLAGNGACLCCLAQDMPRNRKPNQGDVVDVEHGGNKIAVTGKLVKLKQTQTYTSELGMAVWKNW